MTGRELVEWIQENHAEDMEVLCLEDDGVIVRLSPEIQNNMRIKQEYWEASFLPDIGESVIL